jgi:hypothetical protein
VHATATGRCEWFYVLRGETYGPVSWDVVVAVDIDVFVFRGIWILGFEKTVVFTRFFGPRVVAGRIFDIPAVGR